MVRALQPVEEGNLDHVSTLTRLMLLGLMGAAPADRAVVPVELQVEVLAKVVRYDRNFAARAGAEVGVLVLHAPDAPESERVARQWMSALKAHPKLGGVGHHDELVAFAGAAPLAELLKARGASLVVFAPGFSAQAGAIASALDGLDVLTVSATSEGVKEGLVLGFDLVSGKPRMLLNLSQSRRQHVDFRADVLLLMTVFP